MKVVIADDTLQSQMQAYLTLRSRHVCEIAEDRETAIRLAQEYYPDVILLALGFDSQNGKNGAWRDLIKELRERAPKSKLIGIGNSDKLVPEEDAKEMGIERIIQRPIRRRKLLEIIAS